MSLHRDKGNYFFWEFLENIKKKLARDWLQSKTMQINILYLNLGMVPAWLFNLLLYLNESKKAYVSMLKDPN